LSFCLFLDRLRPFFVGWRPAVEAFPLADIFMESTGAAASFRKTIFYLSRLTYFTGTSSQKKDINAPPLPLINTNLEGIETIL
jgi:hypothetical protein